MSEHRLPDDSPAAAAREERLAAWLAGDLAPGSDEEMELLAASAADPTLLAEMAAHRELRQRLRTLPVEVDPAGDLWGGIAARLDARGGGAAAPATARWWRGRGEPATHVALALAAALALALGAGLFFAAGERTPAQSTPPVPVAATAAPAPPATLGLAAYAETDRELALIRDELYRAIERRREQLPPETRAVVFANLQTIDRAIAEIEAALAAAPGDPQLARTYIDYREREIALLRQANQLAARL